MKTVLDAEYFIELKLKKIGNLKLHYKKLLKRLDENLLFLKDQQIKKEKSIYIEKKNENFFVIELLNGENFNKLCDFTEIKNFYNNTAYLIMKYCDILKDSGAKKISQPIWNEKFRMY